jgi:hypothetical protein
MPGKIAHLVPMQRFDPTMKRTLPIIKPSNTDYHHNSSTNIPPITTTSPLGAKTSLDDPSMIGWPPPPPFSSSQYPIEPPTSMNSLKPPYDQVTRVNNYNNNNPDNAISQTRLQTILSRFRQDTELIPRRFDVSVKRSSV